MRAVIVDRWKSAVEPLLAALVSNPDRRRSSVAELTSEIPSLFNEANWDFSPTTILQEQQLTVQAARGSNDATELLRIFPGKPLLPLAARACGMDKQAYVDLITATLSSKAQSTLQDALVAALSRYLPARAVAVQTVV